MCVNRCLKVCPGFKIENFSRIWTEEKRDAPDKYAKNTKIQFRPKQRTPLATIFG